MCLTRDFRYTEVYKEYCTLFESTIEKLISSSGYTTEQFYTALQAKTKEEDAECEFYVEMLLAVTDFTQFVQMISHYKRDHVKKE